MPAIYDSDSGRATTRAPRKKKRLKKTVRNPPPAPQSVDHKNPPKTRANPITPDQADRERSPQQKAADARTVAKNVRESREKYLAKKGRGAGTRLVKRELEGKGVIAHTVSRVAEEYASDPGGSRIPGAKHAGVTGFKLGDSTATRAVKDFVNLPAQTIPSVYVPAAAAVEAAKGDTSRGKQFVKDIKENDPVYNLGAAGVEKVRGNDKAASEHLEKAKKAASEHPGYTAAELYGVRGAVGRTAGAGVRGAAKVTGSETLKKVGTTERAPRRLDGTNVEEQRKYSKDLIVKSKQVLQDRNKRKVAGELRDEAAKTADPDRRVELERQARAKDPTVLRDRDIARRVDEHVDAAEQVRRHHRTAATAQTRRLTRGARKAGPLLSLLSQRIVRPDVGDLKAYVRELEAEHPSLGPAGRRANEQLRHKLGQAISGVERGKLDLGRVAAAADEYAARSRAEQEGLVKRGMLDAEQAERASLIPYAVRRMGARQRTGDEIAAATKAVKTAKSELSAAQREHSKRIAEHGTARGRAAVLSRNVGGRRAEVAAEKVRVPARYAAGGHGVRLSEEALSKAQERVRVADEQLREAMRAEKQSGLTDAQGRALSTEAIRAHMAAAGDQPPAFLSQAPNARGAKNFYVNAARPPNATGTRRTGEATRKGTFDAHPDTLEEQSARTQGLTDAFDHFQQFVDEFGYRDPRGRGGIRTKRTKAAADQVARDLSAGDTQWTAVRVNPFGATKEQLHRMLEGTEPDTPMHTALTKALAGDDGEGPWAIVPKAAADRMQEHLRVLNPGNTGRAFRAANSTFRKTVLATSLPWLVGNVTEAGLRTALARAGPRSYVTGRRVLKRAAELDPARAELSAARTVGGGHFGFAERQHVHTNLDQFTDGVTKDVGRELGRVARSPGPKQLAAVWNIWTHHVFQTVNKTVEQQFQTAMLGKAVRDNLMTDQLLKLSQKATDDAARGILDRNTAAALGREIDRMYGKYGKFSPDMRKALALYTPFAAWSLNALTFVVRTLPQDHPVALAAIAASVNATGEWRAEHGLDKFIDGAVPGWLQGSIPGKDGVKYRAPTRYTPFGFFTDPLGTASGAVLPQFSGVLAAFRGQDWKGTKLRNPDGTEMDDLGKAQEAAKAFAEATVPVLALAGRIKKKGAKGAILDATIGKVEPQKPAETVSAPRLSRKAKGSFGGSSYGTGSYGKGSYGGSSFK